MSGYGRFACYYDKLTENVDYGKIAARCHEFIKRYSSEHEVVLDLACGTGSLSEALARLDYDVVGVRKPPNDFGSSEISSLSS